LRLFDQVVMHEPDARTIRSTDSSTWCPNCRSYLR